MARRRTSRRVSSVAIVPRSPQYAAPPVRVIMPRALATRGRVALARRGGTRGIVRRVGGLSLGGAVGTAMQGTLQGLGTGPILSKLLVIAAGVALGSGSGAGSWSDYGTDGMIASAGSGVVFDTLAWWRTRNATPDKPASASTTAK